MFNAIKRAFLRTVEAVQRVFVRTVTVRVVVFVARPAALRVSRPRCSAEMAERLGQLALPF